MVSTPHAQVNLAARLAEFCPAFFKPVAHVTG
jgi:hypothetical protein